MLSFSLSTVRFLFPAFTTLLVALSPLVSHLPAQGTLVPPGAPVATMRTLAQIEPRTPLESLAGDSTAVYLVNSPGAYYVSAGNVAGVSGKAAIAINSSGVTIDLNGFSLIGVGGATRGIEIRGAFTNLAIRNGGISTWSGAGIGLSTANAPTGVILDNLRITSVGGPGIDLRGGNAVSVTGCSVTGASSGILLGAASGTAHACAVANLAGAGAQTFGILAGSVSSCEVNTVATSGGADCQGILARVAHSCSVTAIDSGGSGNSSGIQADTVTACAAATIGATASGVSQGIGGTTISACNVSNVGGPSSSSVQYGIVGSGTVSDCTVITVGSSSSSALMYGIQADIAARCRVTSISCTSSMTGIAARLVNSSVATNLVHLGAATGSMTGINGDRVSDCQVDVLGANTSAPAIGIFAKRSISGSTASGVANFGTGGSFGLDLGTGCEAAHCQVAGASTTGIRATGNAKITECEVSGATIAIGIDCQVGGSLVDGNNVFGCTTGIKAAGVTLVVRNHVTNSPTKFTVTASVQLGPVSNAAGTILTTVSPWANFTD